MQQNLVSPLQRGKLLLFISQQELICIENMECEKRRDHQRGVVVVGSVHLDHDSIHKDTTEPSTNGEFPLLPPKIVDIASLNHHLPSICSTIFHRIGSQQSEATYQRCLEVDLKEAGIPTVVLEPEIELLYKGHVVGTRRPDILLKLQSGERVLLELKAVDEMNMDHRTQLEYYLHHTGIEKGYLINFPHDCRYPTVDDQSSFSVKLLMGMMKKMEHLLSSGHALRLQNAPQKRPVEVLEVTRRSMTEDEQQAVRIKRQSVPRPRFGIKANGEECKNCIRQGKFCHLHLGQKPK
jgi:GxxExxY protein